MPDTGYRMPDTGLPAGRQDTRIFIYDLFGRKQDEIIIPPGKEQTRIDISSYPAGVYVAVLKSGDAAVARGKFVKH